MYVYIYIYSAVCHTIKSFPKKERELKQTKAAKIYKNKRGKTI